MVTNFKTLFIFIALLFSFSLYSQSSSEFKFYYSDDNNPTFIQTIKWMGSQYAKKYNFELRNSNNKVIVNKDVTTAFIELSLGYGRYTFRVSTYNVLDQIENISEWKEINIRKAIIPKIDSLSPNQVFLEEWEGDNFILYGSNFEDDIKLYQVFLATKKEIPIVKKEKNRISFTIDKNSILSGDTKIRIVNPGEIYADIPLVVKFKKNFDIVLGVNWAPGIHTKLSNYENVVLGGTQDYSGLPEGFASPTANYFNPFGIGLDFIVYPYKTKSGNLGIGLNFNFKKFDYQEDITKLDNESIDLELMIYYKYTIKKYAAFYLRAGVGAAFFSSQFYYDSEKVTLADDRKAGIIAPAVKAGLGFQFIPYKGLSLFFGIDYKAFLFDDFTKTAGDGTESKNPADFYFIEPTIGFGYQF